MTLYAATSNPGKLAEFATSASSSGIEVLALPNLASIPEPLEDADTFQGNADLKASAYSLTAPGLLVFADDSGLAVDALQGAPGVRSARYADDLHFEPGLGPKDDRNNRALLHQLASAPNRRARFICTLTLARNGQILLRSEGFAEGEILTAPRGTAGFGYDPLFFLPALGLTMAELSRDQKWQLSHRGNAFRSLLSKLIGTDLMKSHNSLDNRLNRVERP
jgi:XTP/dITP diphosphohydrolase